MPLNVATVVTERVHGVRFVRQFGFGLSDEALLKEPVALGAVRQTREKVRD